MVLIENVECVSAQLESKPLGNVGRLRETDIEITVAGLPEILYSWSVAGIEVEATGRLERVHVQNGLVRVKMCRRLQKRVRAC